MDNNKIPSKSLAEIFKDYPRFLDMPALMDIEFSKLTDRNEDLFIQKRDDNSRTQRNSILEKKIDIRLLLKMADNQHDDELLNC